MSGAEALELALGLLHAPARRELLANRPLPVGMTGLLAVAAGSLAAQLEASARTGATREELQEAARFFVQQVLLVPGADAYRTLGATADAPQSRLNEHHRLLQRWLHPDRDADHAWDSAFSARVNAAWSRVRTPHAREAYDAELAALDFDYGQPDSPAPPEAGDAQGSGISEAGYVVPTPDEIIFRNPNAPAVPAGPGYAPDVPDTLDAAARPRRPPVRRSAAIAAAVIAAVALAWFAFQRESAPPAAPAQAAMQTAGPAGAAPGEAEPAPDLIRGPTDSEASPTVGHGEVPGHVDVGHVEPAPVLIRGPTDSEASTTAGRGDVSDSGDSVLGQGYAPDASSTVGRGDVSGHVDVGHAEPAPDLIGGATHVEAAPATSPPPDPFALFAEAEYAVAQLTRWLASGDGRSPPIWNDVGTEAAAARARASLHERRSGRRAGELAIDAPRWTLGNDRAAMDGSYRHGSRRAGEQGRLQVELVRREERWLVTAVHMEPAQ